MGYVVLGFLVVSILVIAGQFRAYFAAIQRRDQVLKITFLTEFDNPRPGAPLFTDAID